jgi:hypothetical protein
VKGAVYLMLLASAPAALACSCIGPRPVCSEFFKTPLVFYGRVLAKKFIPGPATPPGITAIGEGRFEVRFAVLEAMRGDAGQEMIIGTAEQGGMCGIDFVVGANYVVYGAENPAWRLFTTGICTRTHLVADGSSDEDLRWFHALAQAPETATIYGKVRNFLGRNPDSSGQVGFLAGTKITVSGSESRTVLSGEGGDFRVEGLTPGEFTVTATPPEGFAAIKTAGVSVEPKGCAEVVFETRLDGHIRGHVYFSDGRPAPDIALTAKNVNVRYGEGFYATSAGDGSFDFSPLTPGTYSFGVRVRSPWASGYNQSAVFPENIEVGPAESGRDLRFMLPPDRPAPSIPVEVLVVDREGQPVAGATVFTDDSAWPDLSSDAKRTDGVGHSTTVLRKGSHYNIWAFRDTPNNRQECAEPVGITAEQAQVGPVRLQMSHNIGNCRQFEKRAAGK